MPPRKGKVRGWRPSAIRELLLNEKYRGFLVWNRMKTIRNRETGRSEQRPRPQSEWIRIEVPEMRIVSDELWSAVREQNRRAREKHGPRVLGGMNRTRSESLLLVQWLIGMRLVRKKRHHNERKNSLQPLWLPEPSFSWTLRQRGNDSADQARRTVDLCACQKSPASRIAG